MINLFCLKKKEFLRWIGQADLRLGRSTIHLVLFISMDNILSRFLATPLCLECSAWSVPLSIQGSFSTCLRQEKLLSLLKQRPGPPGPDETKPTCRAVCRKPITSDERD